MMRRLLDTRTLTDLEALERFCRDVRDGRVRLTSMQNLGEQTYLMPEGRRVSTGGVWTIHYEWNRDIEGEVTHDVYVGDVSKGLVKL